MAETFPALEPDDGDEIQDDASLVMARVVVSAARERDGEDLVVLDISKISSFADYFVFMSAQNERHVKALVDIVLGKMRDLGHKPHHTEGGEGNRWVLIDFVDVVVHVFVRELRNFYNVERLWTDAPEVMA